MFQNFQPSKCRNELEDCGLKPDTLLLPTQIKITAMDFKLKYFVFLITLSSLLFSCGQDRSEGEMVEEIQTEGKISSIIRSPVTANGMEDTLNVAKMKFEQYEFDFGEVKEGDEVERVFKFENVGKVPLLISHASSSCGCTVPEWPKEAIEPGEEGEILVRFNTTNKPNNQEKSVSITANTYPSVTKVMLKGFVNPKD